MSGTNLPEEICRSANGLQPGEVMAPGVRLELTTSRINSPAPTYSRTLEFTTSSPASTRMPTESAMAFQRDYFPAGEVVSDGGRQRRPTDRITTPHPTFMTRSGERDHFPKMAPFLAEELFGIDYIRVTMIG